MGYLLVCALAGLLVAAPWLAAAYGVALGAGASILMMVAGILLFMATAVVMIITRLYQRTKASEAFVRTGAGGAKVIRDGGAIVVPVLHQLIPVSLQTLKLEVERRNEDALITHDKLRADIEAEFFVRVQPDRESILQAARSLGENMGNQEDVKALVEDKLVSALRTAAASKTLEQLNSERDDFLAEVVKLVAEDLRSNGLVLETVTISRLDQTDEQFLKSANIFDAQGARKIAEITQTNLTARNELVRRGEQARKQQDVETRQEVVELERKQKEFEARQRAEVARYEAESAREAEVQRIDAQRQIDLADVEKARLVGLANRQREQVTEVAEREKEEEIARAEMKRAAAQRELATAEAEREQALQRVETVKVTEAAEREKAREVIEAQARAEQAYVAQQRSADAAAYSKKCEAEARRAAAQAEAIATRTKAEAEADAERQRAAGEKAKAMVPVEVQRASVEVDRDRLATVVKPELEARERHGKVAQEFELSKLAIDAERQVRVAMAQATASLFKKMEANLYGTPDDVTRVMKSVVNGQSMARTIGGFFEAADEKTLGIVDQIAKGVRGLTERGADESRPDAAEIVADEEESALLEPASDAAPTVALPGAARSSGSSSATDIGSDMHASDAE